MMEKIKSNLIYVFCAGLGFLNLIFMLFPYVASFVDMGAWGGTQSEGISGYEVMKLWDGGFGGIMSSIFQIIILLIGLVLLAYGIAGLLKVFGIFDKLPESIGRFSVNKLGEFVLIGFAGLHVLQLVFLIILTATHTEKAYGVSAGIKLSAGIFIALIIYAGAVAAYIVLKKKFPVSDNGITVTFSCIKCGKKAREKDKFCSACGGEIERKEVDNRATQPETKEEPKPENVGNQ